MELWVGALNLGFLYAFVAIGIYITFRIHDFPDITVDGTFTTGAAVTSVLVVAGTHPLLALLASFLACAAAGSVTALINTRLNVNSLLAGILVMTGLYSINLHIMGRSNIPLLHTPEFFALLNRTNPGMPQEIWTALWLTVIMALSWLAVSSFFKTDFGLSMRASGNNPVMARAAGINVDRVKIFGVAIANGLVGISGSLVAQYQGFADIGMGIGTVVTGLASVIIGESILKKHSVYAWIVSAIIGSVIFRFMIAGALYAGMDPIDLKLLTAIFVLITLVVTAKIGKRTGRVKKKHLVTAAAAAAVILAVLAGIRYGNLASVMSQQRVKIGVFQVSENPSLTITRDSFLEEMKRLGYEDGKNATFLLENANGDLATANAIVDKFLHEKVDIFVPISTSCTQVAVKKVKEHPVVFATVADPFVTGAGKTDTDHLPNVTGVYGPVPMDRTMEIVTKILPGRIRIGVIWDPSQANSEVNVNNLKKALEAYPRVTFVGGNIAGSSEVYQAASSLVRRGIDAFVLPTDNIVYSAFDSVVKAARRKKVPIIFNDVGHPEGGALVVFGYAYETSGRQAAHLVNRIIKGEEPATIPFERYKKTELGVNLKVAKESGLRIPEEILSAATIIVDERGGIHRRDGASSVEKMPGRGRKRLALFQFTDNVILDVCAKGVVDGLKKSGALEKEGITVDHKMAHGEFPTAQSIAQEMVSKNYDYIVTVSTISLQVTANHNRKIPHVFAAVTDPIKAGVAKS
ncbi:MAG TPA: ABC transporter substrate binding protein, partial [Syntrophorhabdaceae bacterium]|nr:ABC transporter substrate binding protein [Syntrophorhabdaceae bacterium]